MSMCKVGTVTFQLCCYVLKIVWFDSSVYGVLFAIGVSSEQCCKQLEKDGYLGADGQTNGRKKVYKFRERVIL